VKIMAIGAHPTDVFDLAGGTLANFAENGHEVYLAVVTHGAYSHAPLVVAKDQCKPLAEVAALKRKECEEAGRYIPLQGIRFFEFDDEPFVPSRQMILALGEHVCEIRPEIIITHHPRNRLHQSVDLHPLILYYSP
jgi:LmbE family N-acetylglucosaminyl deacetylase